MKKIIVAAGLILTVGLANAQTDSTRGNNSASGTNKGTQYEYYPEANVYYNDANQTYWYHDSASNQWQSGAQLPTGYAIDEKTKKNTFYYSGANVWEKNADHMKMYGKKSKNKKTKDSNPQQ